MNMFNRLSSRHLWRLLIVVAISWGSLLRFYGLEKSVYWEDETFTSLRLSGYTEQELVSTAFQGEIVYPEDLLEFQIAHADRSLGDTVSSLANDTHPPGYFVLLRLWTSWTGDHSIASIRALSAVVSLLLLPSVFGLAWLLFERSPQRQAIAELSAALVAVSPYQIALANEARMYSLLPVVTTIAGICLLWALRSAPKLSNELNRCFRWVGYGIVSTASLYIHWLAVPVLAGYGLYVQLRSYGSQSRHWAQARRRYLLTTALTTGAVIPWIVYMGRRLSNVYYYTKWAGETVPFWGTEESLGQLWLSHGLLLFFNGDFLSEASLVRWIGGSIAIVLVIYALVYLIRHSRLRVWSFLLISSSVIYVPLAIADVLLGGRRSGIFRYLSPSLGAIEISVAFCLVSFAGISLIQGRKHHLPRRLAQGAIVCLLIGGALSQTLVRATYSAEHHPVGQVASIINRTPDAMLVSDAPRPSLLLPLAHLLKNKTPLILTIRPGQPTFKKQRDRPTFLYQTSAEFQSAVRAQGNRLKPVPGVEDLLVVEDLQQANANL